jgi:hypothetical protein
MPQLHMLSAMKNLTDKECEAIMDVLKCTKCVKDSKRGLYYFMNAVVDEAK